MTEIIVAILAALFVFFIIGLLASKQNSPQAIGSDLRSFLLNPDEFHKKFVEVEGVVVSMWKDGLVARFKKGLRRTFSQDTNHRGKHPHKTFQVKISTSNGSDTILVIHNEHFGRLDDVVIGTRIAVKGTVCSSRRTQGEKIWKDSQDA